VGEEAEFGGIWNGERKDLEVLGVADSIVRREGHKAAVRPFLREEEEEKRLAAGDPIWCSLWREPVWLRTIC